MATTTRDNAPATRRRPRRTSRRLILLVALVTVVGAVTAGGWYFWQHRKTTVVAEPLQPIYVAIKPFVVTVLDNNQTTRFVQVGVDLEVANQHAAEQVKQALPAIQDAIRLAILQSRLKDVTSPQGVETLRKQLIAQANNTIDAMLDPPAGRQPKAKAGHPVPTPQPLVRNVYFTELVVE